MRRSRPVARKRFGGTLAGRLVVTAGLGGMGGAQPLAITMCGGTALCIEVDPQRIERRIETGYLDERAVDLDDALARLRAAAADGRPLSVGLPGNAAEVVPELVARDVPVDVVTDQTSAHDPLNGYVPAGLTIDEADALRASDPDEYLRRVGQSVLVHVAAIRTLGQRGAEAFDYGNARRGLAAEQGDDQAFAYQRFVPAYIRPLFCEGKGPFRWVALSGDPEDIARTDHAILDLFGDQELGRDHLDAGSVASPQRETEAMRDGSDAIADWPLLNALLNTACGASWVSIHHGGGVGMGKSIHAGQVVVADGTPEAAARIERVLQADPGMGVVRHANAGYPEAVVFAREHGLQLPMLDPATA